MKRTIYLLAFLLAFLCQLNAQFDMRIELSEAQDKALVHDAVQLESGDYISVKSTLDAYDKVFIELLDIDMKLMQSAETELVYKKSRDADNKFFRSLEYFGGKVYLFYSVNKDENYSFKLYAAEIDLNTLSLTENPLFIGDFDKKGSKDFGRLRIEKSSNEEYMVIYFQELVQKTFEEKEYLKLLTLDQRLSMIWEKEALEYTETKSRRYMGVEVNNAGEVFVLEQWTEGKVYFKQKKYPLYNYFLYKFDRRGAKRFKKDLELDGRFTIDLDLSTTLSGDLVVSGVFYLIDQGNGVVYQRFNAETLKLQASTFNRFDLEYLVEGVDAYEEKVARKNYEKGILADLPITVRGLVHKPDGGMMLLGEKYSKDRITSSLLPPVYKHSFGEIFIINLDALGNIVWKKKLFKRQSYVQSEFPLYAPNLGEFGTGSFIYTYIEDRLVLFFNSMQYDEESDKYSSYGKIKLKRNLYAVSIFETGKVDRQQIFKSSDHGVVIYPSYTKTLNEELTEFMLVGVYKDKQRLAHFVIE